MTGTCLFIGLRTRAPNGEKVLEVFMGATESIKCEFDSDSKFSFHSSTPKTITIVDLDAAEPEYGEGMEEPEPQEQKQLVLKM